jgi:arylsulfatase A-like enzyme
MDLFATILEFASAEVPEGTDAVSLAEIRSEPAASFRDCVVGHFNGFDVRGMYLQRMLHTGRHKYVFNPGDIDELYDLETDPHELENRIDDPAMREVRRDLAERLAAEMKRTGDPHAHHVRDYLEL